MICCIVIGAIFCAPIYAGTNPEVVAEKKIESEQNYSEKALGTLIVQKRQIITLQSLVAEGTITQMQCEQGKGKAIQKAQKAAGHEITEGEILSLEDKVYQVAELTALQKVVGFISFKNILWTICTIVFVASIGYLLGDLFVQLAKIFTLLPKVVYEVLFYIASGALVVGGYYLGDGLRVNVAFAGCLMMIAALTFTGYIRKIKPHYVGISVALFVLWAACAIVFESQLIGVITILALMSALGFSAMVLPMCYVIGFKDEDSLVRGTTAAMIILSSFAGLVMFPVDIPYIDVFDSGVFYVASFVGYLGLLITTSKWYISKDKYVLMQVVMLVACAAGLFVGGVFGIGVLQKMSGTFLVLYLIEKPTEIPFENARGLAGVGLVVSGVIYALCMWISYNPELANRFLLYSGIN